MNDNCHYSYEIEFMMNGTIHWLCPLTKHISYNDNGRRVIVKEPYPGFKQQLLHQFHMSKMTPEYTDYIRSMSVYQRQRMLPADVEDRINRDDLIRLTSENNELKNKIQKLETSVLNKEFAINQLKQKSEKQTNEINILLVLSNQQTDEINTLKSTLEQQNTTSQTTIIQNNNDNEEEVNKYKELFKEGKKKISNLEKNISNLEKQIERSNSDTKSLINKIDQIKKQLDDKTIENKRISDQNDICKNTIKNMTKQCQDAKELIKNIRDERDKLSEQNIAQQTIMEHLSEEIMKKEAAIKNCSNVMRIIKERILDNDVEQGKNHRIEMNWKSKYNELKLVFDEQQKHNEYSKQQSEYHINLRLEKEAELEVANQHNNELQSSIEKVSAELENTKLKYNELRMKFIHSNNSDNIDI